MFRYPEQDTTAGAYAVVFLLIAFSVIAAAIMAYFQYFIFSRLPQELNLLKRRRSIAPIYSLAIFNLAIGVTGLHLVGGPALIVPHNEATFVPLYIIKDLLYNPAIFNFSLLLVLRYWLIFYDINFMSSQTDLQWKECITTDIDTLKAQKWFVLHRQNYGNSVFMMKRVIVIGSVISALSVTFVWLYAFGVVDFKGWHFINLAVFAVVWMMFLLLTIRMPSFNDRIYLKQEAKLLAYAWIFGYFVWAIFIGVELMAGRSATTYFFTHFWVIATQFSATCIPSMWVLHKIRTAHPMKQSVLGNTEQSLAHILSDEKLFHGFMQHLIEEFCFENLIALIELQQFREGAMQALQLCDKETQQCATADFEVTFEANVPRSDIVYGSGHGDEDDAALLSDDDAVFLWKRKAYRLFSKYIRVDSDFELNIRYKTRLSLLQAIQNYRGWIANEKYNEKVSLVKVFDETIREIFALMDSKVYSYTFETECTACEY